MTDQPPAAVQLRAAALATIDARAAWRDAHDTPDEERTRAAFRLCVLASRLVRRAVGTLPDGDERRRMLEEADQIDATANDLKVKLARLVEGGISSEGAME